MLNNRGSSALLAGANYSGALMEHLKMGQAASKTHPFRGRLERLLAHVERVYSGPTDRPALSVQSHDEYEELREQYAPLFWHYLGRALRATDGVEFALMEARIRCLLREFRADAARVLDGP